MMQKVKIPERVTKFLLDHEDYLDEFSRYCEQHFRWNNSRDVMIDFWTSKGFGDEIKRLIP